MLCAIIRALSGTDDFCSTATEGNSVARKRALTKQLEKPIRNHFSVVGLLEPFSYPQILPNEISKNRLSRHHTIYIVCWSGSNSYVVVASTRAQEWVDVDQVRKASILMCISLKTWNMERKHFIFGIIKD